jgi:hypothetical protein
MAPTPDGVEGYVASNETDTHHGYPARTRDYLAPRPTF